MLPNSALESMFLFFMIVVETVRTPGNIKLPHFGEIIQTMQMHGKFQGISPSQCLVWVGSFVGNGILEFESRVVASSLAMNGVNCVDPFFLAFNWANHQRINTRRRSGWCFEA